MLIVDAWKQLSVAQAQTDNTVSKKSKRNWAEAVYVRGGSEKKSNFYK